MGIGKDRVWFASVADSPVLDSVFFFFPSHTFFRLSFLVSYCLLNFLTQMCKISLLCSGFLVLVTLFYRGCIEMMFKQFNSNWTFRREVSATIAFDRSHRISSILILGSDSKNSGANHGSHDKPRQDWDPSKWKSSLCRSPNKQNKRSVRSWKPQNWPLSNHPSRWIGTQHRHLEF